MDVIKLLQIAVIVVAVFACFSLTWFVKTHSQRVFVFFLSILALLLGAAALFSLTAISDVVNSATKTLEDELTYTHVRLTKTMGELVKEREKSASAERKLAEIAQRRVYIPESAVNKNVLVLKKEIPLTGLLSGRYWSGQLKEIRPDGITLIDTNGQTLEITMEEVWGYKIE